MQLIQVSLFRDPEDRKNTIRYNAAGDPEQARHANISMVYVKKTALAAAFGGFPDTIKLTIEKP